MAGSRPRFGGRWSSGSSPSSMVTSDSLGEPLLLPLREVQEPKATSPTVRIIRVTTKLTNFLEEGFWGVDVMALASLFSPLLWCIRRRVSRGEAPMREEGSPPSQRFLTHEGLIGFFFFFSRGDGSDSPRIPADVIVELFREVTAGARPEPFSCFPNANSSEAP